MSQTVSSNSAGNGIQGSGVEPEPAPVASNTTSGIVQLAAPKDIRSLLLKPGGPTGSDLANFRALAEVKTGFEEMQRNMAAAIKHPEAFAQYQEGWNAICDLLQEVSDLCRRVVELDKENDIVIDLLQEVGDLKAEVLRLENENKALRQDNADVRETLNSKISAIDAWICLDSARARARGEAAEAGANG